MADNSAIDWTDATLQVVAGCTECSPGCANCYSARLLATRHRHLPWAKGLARMSEDGAHWTGEVITRPDQLEKPLHWTPRTIFVGDRGDVFHPAVPGEFINALFNLMRRCPQHTFLVLTKRPIRLKEWAQWFSFFRLAPALPKNIWVGVSVCVRDENAKIKQLRETPAAHRFLSLEPLLEDLGELDLAGIDCVIVGGESGYGARPLHPQWVRNVRDQCLAAKVPFFFKQWGQWAPIDQPWEQNSPKDLVDNEQWLNLAGGQGFHGEQVWRMRRVGSKKAGRVLDGREWREIPWKVRGDHRFGASAVIESRG